MLAANIAADLSAWCRLLGLYDCADLKDAEPDTLGPALEPARPAGPPRPQAQPHLAMEGRLPSLLATAVRPARARLTYHPVPATRKGARPGAVGAGAVPEHIGSTAATGNPPARHHGRKTRHNTVSNQPRLAPESSRLVPSFIK